MIMFIRHKDIKIDIKDLQCNLLEVTAVRCCWSRCWRNNRW